MTLAEALALGLLQGLTEFLPVSSSGHLALLERELGWSPETSIAMSVVVHLGTLLAVVWFYRRPLLGLARERRAAVWPLAVGTAPLVLALPARGLVERVQESPALLGVAFLATAGLLLIADAPLVGLGRGEAAAEPDADGGGEEGDGGPPPSRPAVARLEDVSTGRALLIGVAQLLAIVPGVSRSGSTIATGLVRGLSPVVAAEFSFLLAIPAILGATLVEGRKIGELAAVDPTPLAVAFVAAAATGLGALHLLRWLLRARRFWVFAPYLVALGAWTILRG